MLDTVYLAKAGHARGSGFNYMLQLNNFVITQPLHCCASSAVKIGQIASFIRQTNRIVFKIVLEGL